MIPKKKRLRAAVEAGLEFFFILLYVWFLAPSSPGWLQAGFFWVFCVGFPLICIGLGEKPLPEFSLDWAAFIKSLRWLVWFTLGATVFLAAMAIALESFHYDGRLLNRFSEYVFWAFLQEIGFQTFLTRRVHMAVGRPHASAVVSCTIFALLHFPNPVLMAFSWIGGFFWALSFIRAPNLYAISVSHGWLAVIVLYCSPKSWLHGLRVGPGYWTY